MRVLFAECTKADACYDADRIVEAFPGVIEAEGTLLDEIAERLERFHYDLIATTTFHADEAQAYAAGRVPVVAMIVGPGYMDLIREIAALPPGARVGLVCASAVGTDNIAETLRLSGTTGVEIVSATIDDAESISQVDAAADLILLSREALALGLDERFSQPGARPRVALRVRPVRAGAPAPGDRARSGRPGRGRGRNRQPRLIMVRGRSTAEDFRLARLARTRYSLADLTLAADLATARTIAARVNAGRAVAAPSVDPAAAADRPVQTAVAETGPPLTAGQLHAAGILVAILGRLVDRYRADADPEALVAADAWLRERLGNAPIRTAVGAFAREFPARLAVPETPDPPSAIAQLLLLASLDENSAVDPFRELVDLRAVREGRTLGAVADALEGFFAGRPGFGPEGRTLVELLRQPAAAAPGSLADQLRWIRSNWAGLFDGVLDDLLDRLLVALDVLAEERQAADRAWFTAHDPGAGGPAEVYRYEPGEEERFSEDRDWMPRLVLIAKSTYVWLDQLSRRARARHPDARRGPRRGARSARPLGDHRAVADRPVGALEPPRSGSSGCAAIPTRSPRRTRSTTTSSPRTWADRRPWPACASEPAPAGSAWPATWSPTTWASTRAG